MNKFNKLIFIFWFLFSSIFVQPLFAATNPMINEFFTHPDSGDKEWVEFYNPDRLDLSNYWLDDDLDFNSDAGNSDKKNLSNLINSNSTYPYLEFSSFLNNDGDYVVLFSPDGKIIDQYLYTKDPGNKSFGRFPDGTGEITLLLNPTKGLFNSSPLPTSISTPTKSPTSAPTKKPTSTPKPTPTPKSNPSPTIIKLTTASSYSSSSTNNSEDEEESKVEESLSLKPSGKNINTSITSDLKKPTISLSPIIKEGVLGASQFNFSTALISLGSIFLIICGILVFRTYKKRKIT